jgi:hypothetical protein
MLAAAAREHGLVLLLHASEPVGHAYPGKTGLPLEQLERFILDHPDVAVVAAHWGGGLPFYALMPEVKASLANAYFDTSSTRLLYTPDVYARGIELVGAKRILFGSDFPLITQATALREVQSAPVDEGAKPLVLGENACRLLGLCDDE